MLKEGEEMSNLRPCTYLYGGKRHPALFHGWTTFRGRQNGLKDGDCIALIELPNGAMEYERPKDIRFSDTEKQFQKLQSITEWDISNRTDFHAFWATNEKDEFYQHRGDKEKYCSRCRTEAFFDSKKRKYMLPEICIHCGAIMDLKENDDD